MIDWLKHIMRTHLLAVIIAVLLVLSLDAPALTDSPLLVRKELQLEGAAPITPNKKISGGVWIQVPILRQLPNFYNGCEIASLGMILKYEGLPVSLDQLAQDIRKDPTPLTENANGQITMWGNPNDGFVGNITGSSPGYGVYHGPIAALMRRFLPDETLDVTGISFSKLLSFVTTGHPVLVWTTINFLPVTQWVQWQSPTGPVRATMEEHAVVLVGVKGEHVYVNNPLNGAVDEAVPIAGFHKSWVDLGRQAITVTAP